MATLAKLVGFAPITDGDRAKAFYEGILGLTFVADDGFALVFRSGANMVRLVRMQTAEPVPYTILGWETASIEDDVRDLTSKGVDLQRYSFLKQNADGIWTAPDGDRIAWFKDPDGNTLSLSQHI